MKGIKWYLSEEEEEEKKNENIVASDIEIPQKETKKTV